MSRFIFYQKLNTEEALETMRNIIVWFKENPTRRVCNTDLFKIRRSHIAEDILKRTKKVPDKLTNHAAVGSVKR